MGKSRGRADRGSLFLRLLLTIPLLGAGVFAWRHWDALEPRLNPPLSRVEIHGELRHLAESEIRAVLAPYAGIGFFELNLEQLREQIENLQWVATASAGRRWPDTLSVRIGEETVIARWGEDRLITQRGRVIAPDSSAIDTALPRLDGPPDSQFEVMRQYLRLNQILYPAGLRLSGLQASPRQSWRLQLNGVTEVVLGSEDLVNRLQRYVDFYLSQPETERQRHEVADLRYGSRFSIRMRGESRSAQPTKSKAL